MFELKVLRYISTECCFLKCQYNILFKGYYHQVNSYGTNNVAVALLFSRLDGVDDIDFTGCDENLSFKPLSEMELDWEYPGHGNLSMGNTDLESVRYSIELYFYFYFLFGNKG